MEHSLSSYGRIIWQKISRGWSLDLRSLSLFRVGIALVVLADLVLRSRYIVEHYTDMGLFPRSALQSLGESATTLSFHTASGQLWFIIVLFIIHGLFALSLLVGYRTRLATVVIFIMTVSLHNRDMMINSAADDLLRLVLFWAMFLPLDRYWSWDKDKYSGTQSISITRLFSLATAAYILQQCLMYWVTAYLKLGPEWYVTHSAVYEILALESFHLPLSDIVFQFPGLMRFLTGASMAVEFFGPLLLIFPLFNTWTRYLGILLIFCLHLGIVTTISVGIFPWVSMISMLALLPSHFWEKVIPWFAPSGFVTVYFDDHCGLCSRWIRLLKNFGTLFGVSYVGLSAAKESIQKLSQKHDMWVVSRGRKNTLGYAGFVEIMKQSWLFRFWGKIGNIWPIKPIGDSLYKLISKKRQYCSLPKPVILYTPSKAKKILSNIAVLISIYSVVIMNIAVASCQDNWRVFFRAWPLSLMSIMEERKGHIFESPNHNGWFTRQLTPPKKAESCTITKGSQYDFVSRHSWLKKLFIAHMNFVWWWTFVPRIDQYWGMFAPDPINIDYWFVIDGSIITKNSRTLIHRDLWRDYVFGGESDGSLSFGKYANPHTLTISDRWRKYIYNIFSYTNTSEYRRYFAEYWCKKYNTDVESPYKLDRFTIYGMSQISEHNYIRGPIRSEILWQHCCLQDGCFATK